MIQGFRHKGLKRLFEKGQTKGIRPDHLEKVENILAVLNLAGQPEDMNLPGLNLHRLKGSLRNYWSVSVSGNWRVIFRFEDGYVFDVDYLDYH